MKRCQVKDCISKNYARNKCRKHYDLEYKPAYYAKNKDKILEEMKQSYRASPEKFKLKSKKTSIAKKYFPGLTTSQAYAKYEQMTVEQEGLCAICGKEETRIDRQRNTKVSLSVDHCWSTGLVRGLLCFRCNTSLGWYEKNLASVGRYLKGNKAA